MKPSALAGTRSMENNPVSLKNVISEEMCTGCGACAFARPEAVKIGMNDHGYFSANLVHEESNVKGLETLCPFTGAGRDEDEIALSRWPELKSHSEIGRSLETIACHVRDDALRMASGSGGLVTWLCAELLSAGHVDGVVHLRPRENQSGDEQLFEYSISRSVNDVRHAAKSRYYPMTLEDVLSEIKDDNSRYVIVAVPCFAKAVRALIHEGYIEDRKIPFIIGLVCGHLKSRYFAEYLAWQKGTSPGSLTEFDFRTKLAGREASDYGFTMGRGENRETFPMSTMKARDWGEGQFKLPACEYCDDVLAECADIAIGDAWLPEYVNDYKGTNIVVNRNSVLSKIIENGRISGALNVDVVSAEQVVKSQLSGIRHRREGLSHRLARRIEKGKWVPQKRVSPLLADSSTRRKVYDIRERISMKSNGLFLKAKLMNDIRIYESGMKDDVVKLRRVSRKPFLYRLFRKAQRMVRL